MPDLTDEEYDALDEELTHTVPKAGHNGTGWLALRELRLLGLNKVSTDYLLAKSEATHKTPPKLSTSWCAKGILLKTTKPFV